jgi:histidinol-phosphate aminotransferase
VEHFSLLQPQIERLIRERERLLAELRQTPGVTAYPSQANFIAFQTRHAAPEVFDALYSEGILVRDVSRYPMLDRFLRVSVGSPHENDQFLGALRSFLAATH